MATEAEATMKPTLGLTGLTMNAMALIAPGAFLWLTFVAQGTAGNTAPAMWAGIVLALVLCLATAFCYAELAKLYPGPGSSYFFAEQAFLRHDSTWRFARLSKFIVGWGSHLYYWIYPGVMCGVMGVLCGYLAGTLFPHFMSASNPGPMFMMICAIATAFGVAYIAHRGVNGSTGVAIAINIVQITALLVFAVMALMYRHSHPPGSVAYQWDASSQNAYTYQFATTTKTVHGQDITTIVRNAAGAPMPLLGANGRPVPFKISYPRHDAAGNFLSHPTASSVIGIHNFGWLFVQATIAILLLVGFESVTAMGAEALDPKKHIPVAVITSLVVQGAFCYLLEYFAANYFLNSGYTMQQAVGSAAPIGDMMVMVGDALFNGHGHAFMLIEAATVFLAIIGTTLSCINTGARVTYAMGKDDELSSRFGWLHKKNLTPHRAIWTLATISAALGCCTVANLFGDAGALSQATLHALPRGFWSRFGYLSPAHMAALPNSLLTITLASNFGTFLLYGLSCAICIVAFHGHPRFHFVKHVLIPVFGMVANLACMAFYLIGPFMGFGTKLEPLTALGIAIVWGFYGGVYFVTQSKKKGRTTLISNRSGAAETA